MEHANFLSEADIHVFTQNEKELLFMDPDLLPLTPITAARDGALTKLQHYKKIIFFIPSCKMTHTMYL